VTIVGTMAFVDFVVVQTKCATFCVPHDAETHAEDVKNVVTLKLNTPLLLIKLETYEDNNDNVEPRTSEIV